MKKLKTKEPKLSILILTAASGILLGGLLGMSILLSKQPVVVTSTMEDESAAKELGDYTTYYTPGRTTGMETPNLRSGMGRMQRRSPGPISFSEEEVNYFFNRINFESPAEEGEEQASAPRFGPFNVKINGDEILASFKIVVDPSGEAFEMMVFAELEFTNVDQGPELAVKNLRLNSLPVPGFGGLVSSMIESKIAETPWPEELVEMWQNVKAIEVESDKLITEVGLRRA